MPSVIKKLKNLKRKTKYEMLENYSMLGIVGGALLFAGGIVLSALDTRGISAIISMFGALIAFCSSVSLVLSWLIKDIFKSD